CTVISTSLPWIHWLGSAKGARKGPLALWHKVNAAGPFRPSGSWRGQRSGVGPRFRDAGPGSKAKTSARRSAFTRTGRLRPGGRPSEDWKCWQRVELGIHGLKIGAATGLEKSEKRGVQAARLPLEPGGTGSNSYRPLHAQRSGERDQAGSSHTCLRLIAADRKLGSFCLPDSAMVCRKFCSVND